MNATAMKLVRDLRRQLAEATATIEALVSGQVDAVVDPRSRTPVLLAKAQASLRDSEERYRRIVETANEGIAVLDSQSTITFANPRFAEMLGYTAVELVGMSLMQIVPEAVRAAASLRTEGSQQGISAELEVTYLRKNGTELPALIKTSPIRNAEGEWTGTLGMITDRTIQKEISEALQKSEQQYRQIVETTSDGVVKLDESGRVAFVNRRFCEMLGYQQAEMIGMTVAGFMSEAAQLVAAEALRERWLGAGGTTDNTFRHKDGTEIPVNVANAILIDADGQHAGHLAVVRDVTQQKKMQAQLMVSDRMASVGMLAAGVAHEINNPLAAALANLDFVDEVLEEAKGDSVSNDLAARCLEEIRPALRDAREATQRVRLIVRDLKIFSHSPADEPRGPVDVRKILESSLRMAWNEIHHRAQLVTNYGVVPAVAASEARLGQVCLNLIVNAAQAMPEGRAENNEIRVSTRLEGERVIIEVSDTGVGIAPEIIGRIFDAFFTTKAVGVGAGLGLAISQRIVADIGGTLTVASEVGKGTTFRVSLPIAPATEDVPAADLTKAPSRVGRPARILVVDDDELVCCSVARILCPPHEVVTVVSAKEALARCTEGERFDLILCDVMMPDMTGIDLQAALSRILPEQASKMLFMTGGAFTAGAQEALAQSQQEQIEKPFEFAALRAAVQRSLQLGAAAGKRPAGAARAAAAALVSGRMGRLGSK